MHTEEYELVWTVLHTCTSLVDNKINIMHTTVLVLSTLTRVRVVYTVSIHYESYVRIYY